MFLPEVDDSPPLLCSNIEDTSYSSWFLEYEVSSFDVESFKDRSTTEYVLSRDSTGVVR